MNTSKDYPVPFTPMSQGRLLGYEAHYELSESMQVTQYHCHDYYELFIHLHGGEYMGVDHKLYQMEPNQVFILPPFCMHGLSCTREMRDYERAYLNISSDVMRTLGCGLMDLNQFFQSHAASGQNTYILSAEHARRFVDCVRKIQEAGERAADPILQLQNYALMMGLINLLCRVIDQSAPVREGPASNELIQKVLAYVNLHYTENLHMDELTRLFGVSLSYLSHEFSRFTNRSLYDYILYRRVTLSCQMMMGNDNLNEIAYQCGFNDYSNFLRAFSKVVGTPPSAYRRNLKRYKNVEAS